MDDPLFQYYLADCMYVEQQLNNKFWLDVSPLFRNLFQTQKATFKTSCTVYEEFCKQYLMQYDAPFRAYINTRYAEQEAQARASCEMTVLDSLYNQVQIAEDMVNRSEQAMVDTALSAWYCKHGFASDQASDQGSSP